MAPDDMAPHGLLRLRAEDAEDLAVISAVVQDALISVKDLTYDRDRRRFTLVVNRFRWEGKQPANSSEANSFEANSFEDGAGDEPVFERTLCAVSFSNVETIVYRGFRRRDDGRILALLAIRPGDGPGTIDLEFSDHATLRLGISAINVHATDIGEAWPTTWQPDHSADDPS